MSTRIRLARAGSKKRPYYRIVVADSRAPRDGRFIERVGSYDPMLPKDAQRVVFKTERAQYWLDQGAVPSDRVAVFMNKAGIGKGNKLLKEITQKRDNVIKLKKSEIDARKKEEAKAAKEAAEQKAKEEAEKAAEEKKAEAQDDSEEKPAEEAKSEDGEPAA